MAINLNVEPYNDDFSESKGFHQILFRPGYSVQARELTQLQTILRDQIKKFGNHIFRHGSIVIPGNSRADLVVPYVKVESQYNGTNLDLTKFDNQVVIGSISGVKAIIKKTVAESIVNSTTYPVTFYVTYTSGNGETGAVTFEQGEDIFVESDPSVNATIKVEEGALGTGSLAYISAGVYYVNGSFVYVEPQSTVISRYTSVPNCHVLLKINEEIIDYASDETLLDNAQGSYNYAAPGADRLKIWLELTSLPLASPVTDDFIEIMRYRDGDLEEHARTAKYSELEKSLARRTYDESGNYVVNGLTPTIREHLKRDTNRGVYSEAQGGDIDKYVVELDAGKSYINGFEVEKIAKTRLTADKARTTAHIKNTNVVLRPEYGQYLVIAGATGAFSINSVEGNSTGGTIVDLYDSATGLSGTTAWAAQTSVTAGSILTTNGKMYTVSTAGYTGGTAPIHTAGTQTNAVDWVAETTVATNSYAVSGGKLYKATTGGLTGTAAPTHTTGSVVNSPAWGQEIDVLEGTTLYVSGRLYKVTIEGTTGTVAPTHTSGGEENATLWTASHTVAVDDSIYYGINLYRVTVAGTTGSTAPTHMVGEKSNGTAKLVYVGYPAELTYIGTPTTYQYIGTAAQLTYNGTVPAKVGTARISGIDYLEGDPEVNPIYKLWLSDITYDAFTTTLDNIGSIKYTGADGNQDYAYALTVFGAPITTGGFVAGETITHATSGRTATVRYWDAPTAKLYAYRHNASVKTPQKGDEVVGSQSATKSIISSKNVINSIGSSSLVFELPKNIPYSLKNPLTNSYDFTYTVQKELTMVVSGNTGSVSISSGVINPIEVGTFIAVGPYGVLSNDYFTLNAPGSTISTTNCPVNGTVKIYCAVSKSLINPKTKTLQTNTEVYTEWTANTAVTLGTKLWYAGYLYEVTTAGTTNNSTPAIPPSHTSGSAANGSATLKYLSTMERVTLSRTDIVGLTSVTDSIGDITSSYTVWNGQTDYSYKLGELKLKPGRPLPSGNVTVTYTYYAHSIDGDFFCVNSYASVSNFLEKTTNFVSQSTGKSYDLAACLDFRPSVGVDGTFTGSNSRRNDLPINGTTFNSSLQYYVPRIDSLVIDAAGNINLIQGTPGEVAVEPTIPAGQFELNRFFIPAYTRTASLIETKRMDVERFTMKDIKKIVNRVKNLEDFSTLTASELAVTSYQITDASTGLDRFKTGYLVENFKNPFTIARTTRGDYAASFVGEQLTAPVEELICDIQLLNDPQTDETFVIKGGCVMLPYTEAVFAQQPLSSRVTNLNPFLVIKWDGVLVVDPPADQWTEVLDLPTIFEYQLETITYAWWSPVPSVSRVTLWTYQEPTTVTPAPINLVAYRITLPDGHTYTTVGAPGSYDTATGMTVEVIGETTVNQRSDGVSTVRAIDRAARSIGGSDVIITDDAYRQIGKSANTLSTDAMSAEEN